MKTLLLLLISCACMGQYSSPIPKGVDISGKWVTDKKAKFYPERIVVDGIVLYKQTAYGGPNSWVLDVEDETRIVGHAYCYRASVVQPGENERSTIHYFKRLDDMPAGVTRKQYRELLERLERLEKSAAQSESERLKSWSARMPVALPGHSIKP